MVCFATERTIPTGGAVIPVIKIARNKRIAQLMTDNMDVDVSAMLEGTISVTEAGEDIWHEIVEVTAGKEGMAELLGYQEFSINRNGPTL